MIVQNASLNYEILFKSLADDMRDMVVIKNARDLRFVFLNRAGERLLGYSRQSFVGKTDTDVFPHAQASFFNDHDHKVLDSGRIIEIPEEPVLSRTTGLRYLRTRKIPVSGDDGRPLYLFVVSEDITEIRLRRNQRSLLSEMSHELRTPLSAMMGFAELLLESPALQDEDRTAALTIHRNSGNLLEMLNNILDLAKVDANEVTLNPEPFSPEEMVRDVISLFRLEAEKKSLQLTGIVPLGIARITSDAGRVRQILFNLVSNAVKFTNRGHITIEVRALKNNYFQFLVNDTGAGLNPEQSALLFRPFSQMHGRSVGTGLGLWLSKQLARVLGGDLDLHSSQVGHGSTFALTIPSRSLEPRVSP